jgi:hypothetical protein
VLVTLKAMIAPPMAEHPSHRPRRSLAVVAGVVLVVVVCCATALFLGPLRPGSSEPEAAVVTQQPVPRMPRHQLALLHRANAIAQRHPATFGGAWWDDAKGWVSIGVLSAEQLAPTRAALDAKGMQEVHIEVVKNSLTRMTELERALVKAPSPLHGALVSAGPDLSRNQVLVTTETITPDIRRQIAEIAGEDAVVAKSDGRFSADPVPVG